MKSVGPGTFTVVVVVVMLGAMRSSSGSIWKRVVVFGDCSMMTPHVDKDGMRRHRRLGLGAAILVGIAVPGRVGRVARGELAWWEVRVGRRDALLQFLDLEPRLLLLGRAVVVQ